MFQYFGRFVKGVLVIAETAGIRSYFISIITPVVCFFSKKTNDGGGLSVTNYVRSLGEQTVYSA